jgi:hypothetical protein
MAFSMARRDSLLKNGGRLGDLGIHDRESFKGSNSQESTVGSHELVERAAASQIQRYRKLNRVEGGEVVGQAMLLKKAVRVLCIHPEDWLAAYRAARARKPEWWLAVADDPVEAEELRDSSTEEGIASRHEKEKRSGSEGEGEK